MDEPPFGPELLGKLKAVIKADRLIKELATQAIYLEDSLNHGIKDDQLRRAVGATVKVARSLLWLYR